MKRTKVWRVTAKYYEDKVTYEIKEATIISKGEPSLNEVNYSDKDCDCYTNYFRTKEELIEKLYTLIPEDAIEE
jgi:hypothetical protein